jgi:hypothetical protein
MIKLKTALPKALLLKVGGAAALALVLAAPAAKAQIDPKALLLTPSDQIHWVGDKVKSAVLYGDPKKPGSLYVMLLRWPANFNTRPHSHPNDRMITVLEGTLYVNTGAHYHPETVTPVTKGGFIVDVADQIHYEITKDDGALIEITGIGPDTMVPREEK